MCHGEVFQNHTEFLDFLFLVSVKMRVGWKTDIFNVKTFRDLVWHLSPNMETVMREEIPNFNQFGISLHS